MVFTALNLPHQGGIRSRDQSRHRCHSKAQPLVDVVQGLVTMDITAVDGVQEWPGQQGVSDDKLRGRAARCSHCRCITLLPGQGQKGNLHDEVTAHREAYRYAHRHRCQQRTGATA